MHLAIAKKQNFGKQLLSLVKLKYSADLIAVEIYFETLSKFTS